ncbi:hypothetical protein DSO57_1011712 [Entomophthora muscae]|uniref:Uncharacterized protein n=1 Tax=Entomophthora muscae TaxID=34485 RepID=A0ACC2SJ35_9FUNG|nr:hypothetical protein DSO57_1011712 [Entomophthora muscae]
MNSRIPTCIARLPRFNAIGQQLEYAPIMHIPNNLSWRSHDMFYTSIYTGINKIVLKQRLKPPEKKPRLDQVYPTSRHPGGAT